VAIVIYFQHCQWRTHQQGATQGSTNDIMLREMIRWLVVDVTYVRWLATCFDSSCSRCLRFQHHMHILYTLSYLAHRLFTPPATPPPPTPPHPQHHLLELNGGDEAKVSFGVIILQENSGLGCSPPAHPIHSWLSFTTCRDVGWLCVGHVTEWN
jgi:hypothetical protein